MPRRRCRDEYLRQSLRCMSNPTSPVPLQVPKRRPRRGCSGRHLLRAYLRVTYVTPEVSAYCAPRLRSNSLPLDETTLPVGLASRPEVEVVRRCASVTSVDRREVVAGTLSAWLPRSPERFSTRLSRSTLLVDSSDSPLAWLTLPPASATADWGKLRVEVEG